MPSTQHAGSVERRDGMTVCVWSARALSTLLALVYVCACQGCLSEIGPATCSRSETDNPAVLYTEGTVEQGVYMSSAWDGELLYFPGGMHYKIEHRLGAVPRSVEFYLSFDQYGADDGTVAPAAGD